jgi:hypothetical protein
MEDHIDVIGLSGLSGPSNDEWQRSFFEGAVSSGRPYCLRNNLDGHCCTASDHLFIHARGRFWIRITRNSGVVATWIEQG